MNILNRIVSVILFLALIVLLVLAAVVPWTVIDTAVATLQQARTLLEARWPLSYLVFLAVAIVLVLIFAATLWFELRPQSKKTLSVSTAGGAQVEVDANSVQKGLESRLIQIPNVYKVRPKVRGRRGGVDVTLELETAPEVDIPSKVDEVSMAAKELIQSRMGLNVSNIKVLIKHGPPGKYVEPVVQAPPEPQVTPVAVPPVAPPEPTETPPQAQR
ncbi:MAG TPA: alkaline shock response membrane anchor protein AmaP [Anaerolineae bacterium]|nr:alkaline shock response membrane anchor protein AmaP [Anaerolineae bacterium]HQJ52148.1 alkaline shock response membrane anchor protein AmaP [Anaerolineae bacterium]